MHAAEYCLICLVLPISRQATTRRMHPSGGLEYSSATSNEVCHESIVKINTDHSTQFSESDSA